MSQKCLFHAARVAHATRQQRLLTPSPSSWHQSRPISMQMRARCRAALTARAYSRCATILYGAHRGIVLGLSNSRAAARLLAASTGTLPLDFICSSSVACISEHGHLALGNHVDCRPHANDGVRPEVTALYRLSAEQGVSVAQWRLGLCYENGDGVQKNSEEALRLFMLAANQRFPNAYFTLVRPAKDLDSVICRLS
jgi:TPR repeat protein